MTVSKEWVTVTAPQAAMPPAMKEPMVVDIVTSASASSVDALSPFPLRLVMLLRLHPGGFHSDYNNGRIMVAGKTPVESRVES